MRVGQNPAKAIEHTSQPNRVTVSIITYIPFLSGYYAESLEVLKSCLSSIWQNTPQPYDLLVFDNASCLEVQNYLIEARQKGHIQYLVLSEKNVGKGGAWNFIFQAAPGEVIAYTDSDVYFYPGWLEHSIELLENFPNVGMVTARPLRVPEEFSTSTLAWARNQTDVKLEQGQFISWENYKDHTDSLGVSLEKAESFFKSTSDWKMQYREQVAYAGGGHFQFISWKQVLQAQVPLPTERPMGQVRSLDIGLNEAGYLRLMTSQPLVKHLGNRVGNSPTTHPPTKSNRNRPGRSLLKLSIVRRSLLWVYNKIFQLYFDEQK